MAIVMRRSFVPGTAVLALGSAVPRGTLSAGDELCRGSKASTGPGDGLCWDELFANLLKLAMERPKNDRPMHGGPTRQ